MGNSKFKNETIIRTERLRLRPVREGDVDFIWNARSYRKIYKWTMAGQWLDKSMAHDWIKNALETDTNYNFIIEIPPQETAAAASDEPKPTTIGSIGIFADAELGYLIDPDYWGKGYATEAVSAFIAQVWKGLPEVEKVTAHVDSENAGSIGVLRKCGFREAKREVYKNATMGEREDVLFEAVRPV